MKADITKAIMWVISIALLLVLVVGVFKSIQVQKLENEVAELIGYNEELTNKAMALKEERDLLVERNEEILGISLQAHKELEEYSYKVEELQEGMRELNETVQKLKKENEELKKPKQPIDVSISRGDASSSVKSMYMEATAYTAYCNGCSGTTRTGIDLRANPHLKVIAVDPNVIPLGTKVHVEGYGYAIAGDTGGAIKGNIIDVF